MNRIPCTQIYLDAEGESHFEETEIELRPTDFAPPAPPIRSSEFKPATRYGFLSSPTGWFGDWHPAPKRKVALCLVGTLEIGVSDSEIRRFGPGSVVLFQDTQGKGHTTRVLETALRAMVQLE